MPKKQNKSSTKKQNFTKARKAVGKVIHEGGKLAHEAGKNANKANKDGSIGGSIAMIGGKVAEKIGSKMMNHPDWYVPKDFISNSGINMNRKLGVTSYDNAKVVVAANHKLVLTIPSYSGTCNSFLNSVDIAYRQLRAKNSGAVNYYAQDLAKYILDFRTYRAALIEVRSWIQASQNVDILDRETPTFAMKALDLSDESIDYLFANRAAIIDALNIEIKIYNEALRMMPEMSIFDRDEWLLSCLYLDSPANKAVRTGFSLQSSVVLDDKGNFLAQEFHDFLPQTCFEKLATLRREFTTNKVSVIIQGDIEKLYPDNPYVIPMVSSDQKINEIYNEYINSQLINAIGSYREDVVSGNFSEGKFSDGLEDYMTQFQAQVTGVATFTSSKDDPSLGEQLSMLQFIQLSGKMHSFSTKILNTTVYYYSQDENDVLTHDNYVYIHSNRFELNYTFQSQANNLPMVRWIDEGTGVVLAGDLRNTAEITEQEMKTFIDIAVMKLFAFKY